ncbi:MAG: elongation factor G, partial [Oscillospiraceae bacterium]
FLNKNDRDTANPEKITAEIKALWKAPAFTFSENFSDFGDELALTHDSLMEIYLEGDNSKLIEKAGELFYERKLFPIIRGSALKGEGISALIKALNSFNIKEAQKTEELSCTAYKVRHDANGERITFLRINQGELKPKDELNTEGGDLIPAKQKVHEIRAYSGAKFTQLAKAESGTLCGVIGLKNVMPGDVVGFSPRKNKGFFLTPLMTVNVSAEEKIPPKTVLKALKTLEDEEPLLKVSFDRFEKIHIETMGSIQQEILKAEILQRFGMNVSFGKQQVLLKETIKSPVIGNAHYEPLRHYSELRLLLTPTEEGSGISFSSQCSGDDFSLNWQRLVKTHVFEKEHLGVLTGSPLTDIHITLLAGRAHIEHTAGGDFRECVYRGIRQGLMKGESILLEPIVKLQIAVPQGLSGRVLNDISNMEGSADLVESRNENVFIEGTCPARTISDYSEKLLSFTKGCGALSLEFSHYAPMKNQQEEILSRGYSPESDLENSPDSIFCVHGTALAVR